MPVGLHVSQTLSSSLYGTLPPLPTPTALLDHLISSIKQDAASLNPYHFKLYPKIFLSSGISYVYIFSQMHCSFDLMANEQNNRRKPRHCPIWLKCRSPFNATALPKQFPGSKMNGYNFAATNFRKKSKEFKKTYVCGQKKSLLMHFAVYANSHLTIDHLGNYFKPFSIPTINLA